MLPRPRQRHLGPPGPAAGGPFNPTPTIPVDPPVEQAPAEQAQAEPERPPEPERPAEPDRRPAATAIVVAPTNAVLILEPVPLAPWPVVAKPGGPVVAEPEAPVLGPGAVAVAGVDVGANSVHLLIAVVTDHRVEPIVDESIFLGLGDRVDAAGSIGPAKRAELVAALVRYAATARRLGAERINFVGTEPLRRAADAASAVHEVGQAAGAALFVIDDREEAELTLLGVTLGRPITRELAIVDIGGGSSQLVEVGPGHAQQAIGIRLGGARLTATYVSHDPPTPDEINAMRAEARRVVAGSPAVELSELIAVGGTASNLVKVLPAAMLDRRLDQDRLLSALALLGSEPAAQAAERHAINPTRARLLPAGAVIMEAILAHAGLDGLTVSEAGVREGLVLASARANWAWRDQLATLARGWDDGAAEGS